jgi:hypothetical protein
VTLLDSINRLRQLQRSEGISATSAAQLDHATARGLLNDAASDVLNLHRWSFLRRYDGFAFYPAMFSVTTGGIFTSSASVHRLNQSNANAWAAGDAQDFSTRVRAKLRITSSAEFPDTSFPVQNFDTGAHFQVSIAPLVYEGVNITANGAWEVYTHEYVLPATVRRVLDVFDQEGDVSVTFVDRDLDGMPIRPSDHYNDRAYDVAVGGTVTSSKLNAGSSATGDALTIWPPPSEDVYVQYSYLYRYADLVNDTDVWTGVPEEIIKLIQNVAFEKSLDSNVEDDLRRGATWHGKNQGMLQRLLQQDARDPNRRLVTPEIGTSRNRSDPYRRWSSRTVPSP